MKSYKIGVQNSSIGERCGIFTYSRRLSKYLESLEEDLDGNKVSVDSYLFDEIPERGTDLINIQYEPGLVKPDKLIGMLRDYVQPVVVTVHHIGMLPRLYNNIDGFVFHSSNQCEKMPLDYTVIRHPSLIYPDKDKDELKDKFNLPKDKKVLGTAGFIAGTGKKLPTTVEQLLRRLKDDEFLYLTTAFWKGGDMGHQSNILRKVEDLGKEDQFRLDTDFIAPKTLNEKLQACDLLWTWCQIGPDDKGSQSGIAADMYGARRKLVVADSAHYSFVGKQDKVEVGRHQPDKFAKDVLDVLRCKDLNDIQNPEWLSWKVQAKNYLDYFQEVLGE